MTRTRAGRRYADREERRARIRSMVMTVVPDLSEAVPGPGHGVMAGAREWLTVSCG